MMHPVVVRLRGGLGNQMFQYATALSLALRHGAEVQLDAREPLPGRGQPHLLRWQVRTRGLAPPASWRFSRPALMLARRQRWIAAMLHSHVERGLGFDATLATRPLPLHLDGYFQSERYFSNARAELVRQFQPREPLAAAQQALASAIRDAPQSVAVHVRRGDYLRAMHQAVHGTCDAGYYAAAARLIAQRTGASRFFIFSDDLPWARAALSLPGECMFVEGRADAPEVDLHLMALCRHHVCANSSFSWWGAWLAPSPDQMVVAPARWFADARLDASDIVPSRWWRL